MDSRRGRFWLVFLGGAALLALIPEYFFPPDEEPSPRSAGSAPLPLAAPAVPAAPAEPPRPGSAGLAPPGPLFAAHSWRVVPPPSATPSMQPPPPSVAPAAVAVAPALPFAFIGKLDDSRRLRVFLSRDGTLYTVSVGDVIDGTYRVERIADSEMVLTYLPLDVRQTLSVGGKL